MAEPMRKRLRRFHPSSDKSAKPHIPDAAKGSNKKGKTDVAPSSVPDASVDHAVDCLEKRVHQIIQRYEKKTGQEINSQSHTTLFSRLRNCLEHLRHALTHLRAAGQSFQVGFQELRTDTWKQLQAECSRRCNLSDSVTAPWSVALQQFFQHILRFHDGLIWLESGECRHPADTARHSKANASSLFRSRLGTVESQDGYTSLYKASQKKNTGDPPTYYSGTGWDEIMMEKVGIRDRLLALLKPFFRISSRQEQLKFWDEQILEHALGQPLELVLTEIETTKRTLQTDFVQWTKAVFVPQLRLTLQRNNDSRTVPSVKLDLSDKMERLTVQLGSYQVEWARRAHAFQIHDPHGVLPLGHSPLQWRKILTLNSSMVPARPTAEARFAVSGSDGKSAESNKPAHKGKTAQDRHSAKSSTVGLVIKESVQSTTVSSESTLNVRDMKQQLGINVDALSRAHEELQAEEQKAQEAADAIDHDAGHVNLDGVGVDGDDDGLLDAQDELHEESRRLAARRQVLKRALRSLQRNVSPHHEYDVWDARERLRESLMTVGNLVLWKEVLDRTERYRDLEFSKSLFAEAVETVKQQEVLHHRMTNRLERGTMNKNEIHLFLRNLLLLRGQAEANVGIVHVEWSKECPVERDARYAHLAIAMEHFSVSKSLAAELRALAETQQAEGGDFLETTLDVLRALQLQTLLCTWEGQALWLRGLRQEAISSFEKGANISDELPEVFGACSNVDVVDAALELLAACYGCWVMLADCASVSLGKCQICSTENLANQLVRGDALLEVLGRAIHGASTARVNSSSFDSFIAMGSVGFETFRSTHHILSESELTLTMNEWRDWWDERKTARNQRLPPSRSETPYEPGRSDVNRNDERRSNSEPPPRRFVVNSDGREVPKKRRIRREGRSNILHGTGDSVVSSTAPPRRYRKWGNELLPHIRDTVTGKMIPKLEYPAVAPEMPPDIAAFLEKQRSAQPQ
jgi:hypothetical protein